MKNTKNRDMRLSKFAFLFLISAFTFKSVSSQNLLINVLTQKSGIVSKGGTVFLEVTINNTDPSAFVGVYRVKTQISVPSAIAVIPATGHVLPTGWTILNNNGSVVNLSNGKDMIASNDSRTILIAIKGTKTGGPSTITGQLSFSDGTSPGTTPGSLPRENPADNSSTSTIKVIR